MRVSFSRFGATFFFFLIKNFLSECTGGGIVCLCPKVSLASPGLPDVCGSRETAAVGSEQLKGWLCCV